MSASSTARRGEAGRAADGWQLRCWQCGADQQPAPLCTTCQAVLALPPDADHFQVFGIARRLNLDTAELSRRYYELSRLLHPDAHSTGSAEAREASTTNTAALTRAYRALRDPVARGLYWLELHGAKLGGDNKVPPELAARVFEVQETLEELRAASGEAREKQAAAVRHELAGLAAEREALMDQVQANFAAWDAADRDAPGLLRQLESLLARRAYLATLIRDVEQALN